MRSAGRNQMSFSTTLVSLRTISVAVVAMLFALSASLTLPGCGVKSAPIPPEAARPEQILGLEATSAKNGIHLTWGRPYQYAGGDKLTDLAIFSVSRADEVGPFQKIGQVPVTDQGRFQLQSSFSYFDPATEVGKTYRYQVVSSTADGYLSEPSNVVTIMRKIPPPPPNPETFVLPTPTPLR